MTEKDNLASAKEKVALEQEELYRRISDIFRVYSLEHNNSNQETTI